MLANGGDLIFGQSTKRDAIFQRDHDYFSPRARAVRQAYVWSFRIGGMNRT
jgi:hypothetical protein